MTEAPAPDQSSKPKSRRPRPWDLDAARTGSMLLAAGLSVSVLLHGGIPLAGIFWPVKSISQLPVSIELESFPLPPAEELVDSPDDVNSDGDDEPDAPPDDTDDDAPPDDSNDAVDDAVDDGDDADDTDVADLPPEPPPEPDVGTPPTNNDDLQKRIQERNERREAWLAARAQRLADRQARREARRRAAEEAKRRKGGAPEGGSEEGNPESVYLCTATERGQELKPRTERSITSWMGIVPTVFAHFDTRPDLGGYVSRINQVYVKGKRLGIVDFAAPAEVMQMRMEDGSTIAVGRLDVRCMIGLRYHPRLFPIKLTRLPARIIDKRNKSVAALVDIVIYKDASIDIKPHDKNQPKLPYTSNRFRNGKAIARNIDDHFQAARLASAFAELFGFKKAKKPASTKSKRSKKSSSKDSKTKGASTKSR